MSMANPNNYDNTLPGRLARLEQAVFSSTGASAGKLKIVSASNSIQGFAWAGAATGTEVDTTVSASLTVPPFATTVSILAVATAAVTSNASAGVAIYSLLFVKHPELGITQGYGPNVVVQSNQQMQRVRAHTVASAALPTGTTTLTVTACGYVQNTGTNTDNFLGIDVLALFQY